MPLCGLDSFSVNSPSRFQADQCPSSGTLVAHAGCKALDCSRRMTAVSLVIGELEDEETSRTSRSRGSDVCCDSVTAGECDVACGTWHGCGRRSCCRRYDGSPLSPPLASAPSLASSSSPLASSPLVISQRINEQALRGACFRLERLESAPARNMIWLGRGPETDRRRI